MACSRISTMLILAQPNDANPPDPAERNMRGYLQVCRDRGPGADARTERAPTNPGSGALLVTDFTTTLRRVPSFSGTAPRNSVARSTTTNMFAQSLPGANL